MDWQDVYSVSATEKLQELEEQLAKELKELQEEIEDNDIVFGLPTRYQSSIPIPKTVKHYRRERQEIFKRALNHFLDRVHQLVILKHMLMLRWKRFSKNSKTIESLYPVFNTRLSQIMHEYHDCVSRCQRLSIAKEAHLAKTDEGVMAVTKDDMIVYLRHLICNFHSIKNFTQFLKVLELLPLTHHKQFQSKYPITPTNVDHLKLMGHFHKQVESEEMVATNSNVANPIPGLSSPHIQKATTALAHQSSSNYGLPVTDVENLPLHTNELDELKPQLSYFLSIYGINVDVSTINSSAEEMELYATVVKKFRSIFNRQECMKTFKVYDCAEAGHESMGVDSPLYSLKRESNWLPFVSLRPRKNPYQEKMMTELKQSKRFDEILKIKAYFMKSKDLDMILTSLKQHAVIVREPSSVNKKPNKANVAMWKKIYTDPNCDAENGEVGSGNTNASQSTRPRKASYEYKNTLQMLGLDDSEHDRDDPESLQGGYLSFLMLRYLRIRDLMRTALGILNYFRSIERTITINDGGLSLEGNKIIRNSSQNHRRNTSSDGTVGGGGGLGTHAYLHNTPIDFKIKETEFMSFTEIENHDDFYLIEDERVHVQDLRGYFIIYDSAISDLQNLENDLLIIASYFLERDKKMRTPPKTKVTSPKAAQEEKTDLSIPAYAHHQVDRFAVLLDLWSNETVFLEAKKSLLDCYLEAYYHISDRDEKRSMAQVITNVIHRRPRFDFSSTYFVKTYHAECINIRLEVDLVKKILDKQIDDERTYTERICREADATPGLPMKVIAKQPIAVNMSMSALKNIFLLEFHPSLAIASRIPDALRKICNELEHIHKPETIYDSLQLEHKLMDLAILIWQSPTSIGCMHSTQIQKDLFTDVFVEDPLFMSEIATTLTDQQEQLKLAKKEKQTAMMETIGCLMEIVTVRYRLLDAMHETEILSKLYLQHAQDLGFEKFHMYLRPVQFEFATAGKIPTKPRTFFVSDLTDEDAAMLDRFIPSHLNLAIHELDESHLGRFSFHNRDGILQLLKPGALTGLQLVLKSQIVHKNALLSCVQLAHLSKFNESPSRPPKKGPEVDQRGDKSTKASGGTASLSVATPPSKRQSVGHSHSFRQLVKLPEAFVSLQVEKVHERDIMFRDFVAKKQQFGAALNNPGEMEKVKRFLINEYLNRFTSRMAQYSLRYQLMAYYRGILRLLKDFPMIRDTYFMIGEQNEQKTADDDFESLINDDNKIEMRSRPRRLLSQDGRHVLNIWFIPHNSEILAMFKSLSDNLCNQALSHCVSIVGALHDILQYVCSHARMGVSHSQIPASEKIVVSAGWGGTEGIAAEVREIQIQLDNLKDPMNCQEVSEFMTLKRDVMFLEFECALRHTMLDTFLSTGNHDAYKAITDQICYSLPNLSNIQSPSLSQIYLPVPEPYESFDAQAIYTFPWRSFLGNHGAFPLMLWHYYMIDHYMQLSMSGLNDNDRQVSNGEILGVSLLMEDVLNYKYKYSFLAHLEIYRSPNTGEIDMPAHDAPAGGLKADAGGNIPMVETPKSSMGPSQGESKKVSRVSSSTPSSSRAANRVTIPHRRILSRTKDPIESHRLLKAFLLLWKQLEILKQDWGRRKFMVERIDTAYTFKEFVKAYRAEILLPVLQSVARRLGCSHKYEGIINDNDILAIPPGASEVEIRMRQMGALMECLEVHMIQEVRKKLARELSLVVAERSREEEALPTDLWKRPVMKESYTIARPHIAEQFWMKLINESNAQFSDDNVTFSKSHLTACLNFLSQRIIERERQNYESYTMYYETMLRTHHTLLYSKEQEIKSVNDQLKQLTHNNLIQVQCQMADQVHDLVMEITALRAKITEMHEVTESQEQTVREKVKAEYHELTMNLFNMAFQLKSKFDEFRSDLYDDVLEKVNDTRREAVEMMHKVFDRYGQPGIDFHKSNKMSQAEKIRALERENHLLNTQTIKMKSLAMWKQNQNSLKYTRMINELSAAAVDSRKDYVEVKMRADEEVAQLKLQLTAIRKALADVEFECNEVKQQFEKDLRLRQKHAHIANEKAKTRRIIDETRKENIEKLVTELDEKDACLKRISDERVRTQHFRHLTQSRVKRNVDLVKLQLVHEKNLKLDAFQRVDELQSQAVCSLGEGTEPMSGLGNTCGAQAQVSSF